MNGLLGRKQPPAPDFEASMRRVLKPLGYAPAAASNGALWAVRQMCPHSTIDITSIYWLRAFLRTTILTISVEPGRQTARSLDIWSGGRLVDAADRQRFAS